MYRNKHTQSIATRVLLILAVAVFAFTATVQPSHAILGVGDVSITAGDIPRTLFQIFDRILSAVGSRAYHQALRSVTYRLAQQSAVWLASGDKGKKPLVFQQGLGDALTDIGDQVAGKFLVNVSQGLPVNLCSPASVQSRLKLTIGVSKSIQDIDLFPDRPDLQTSRDFGQTGCSLSDIGGNFQQAFTNQRQALANLSKGFELDRNELGAFLVLRENVQKEKQKQEEQEKSERAGEAAAKAVKDPITGNVTTPAGTVEEVQKSSLQQSLKQEVAVTGDILADAAAIFANTFAQTYLRRLQQGLLRGNIARTGGRGPGGLGSTAAAVNPAFKPVFGEPPSFGISGGSINLISDMSICPSSEDPNVYQSPYNCLLSDGLKSAVEQKLTVAQAVDQGMIPGDTLFPQNHDAGSPNLSEENLKRLRFLRVVPLGWELAASRLGSQAVPFKKLLDCFDAPDNTQGCPEGGQSISHLVDPAWVLALPQAECRALAYSSLPEHAQSPNRQSVCVDLASCLNEDANGNCTGGFGYCTRERVTWQLTGQSCEPQYATCQSFTSPKPLSLLTAYVDNAGCSSQTAGCKWYSTQADSGAWRQDKKIYLNNNAQSCGANQADSREVIPLAPGVNYVKNPGFDEDLFAARPSGIGTIGSMSTPAPEEGGWNFNGQALTAVHLGDAIVPIHASQEITIKPFTYYTLSFFASPNPNPNDASVNGARVEVTSSRDLKSVSFSDYSFAGSNTLTLSVPNVGSYQGTRFAATFYSFEATEIVLHLRGGVAYDDVQLEEIKLQQGADAIATVAIAPQKDIATLNAVPGSGSINVASPTTAYKAYGTENRSVFSNASECAAEETSARKYTPIAGGAAVYARLAAAGLCSAQCNGFDTLLAMPTAIEKLADENVRPAPARFVPDLAESCTREQVGCEAFTNAQTEARAYFNRIESCVLDANPESATFFTWEAGQLKTWQLLKDANSGGPCTVFPQGARQGVVDPATASCQDQAGGSPACTADEAGTLCRTFLDENGVEYQRDANKIVTASSQCTQFRRTAEVSGAQESWYVIPSEANQCSAASAGCREYKGKRANMVQNVFTEAFGGSFAASLAADQWNIPGAVISTDTAGNQGTSLQFGQYARMEEAFRNAAVGHNFTGNAYALRFIAKAAADGVRITAARLSKADNSGDHWFLTGDNAALPVAREWREYTLGPAVWSLADQPGFLHIDISGGAMLIDDLELVQIPDTYYRLERTILPQSQGGLQPDICYAPQHPSDPTSTIRSCQAYRDDKNNTYYVSRFDKLFGDARSLTCTAVIDTQNSDSPYSQAFNMGTDASPAWYPVPADQVNYRYIDPANKAAASAAGCTALGQPPVGTPTTGQAVTSWSTAYKRIDPDEFLGANGSLCNQGGLWCEAFTAASGGTYYFRDPGDKLCSWSPKVEGSDSGGFVDKNNAPCNIADKYVPQCPGEADSCTAYQPKSENLSEGSATTLFKLASEVTAGDCSGAENLAQGCVEFEKGYATAGSPSAQYNPDAVPKSKLSGGPTNAVLSVTQARQCAEWLAPTTTSQAKEPSTQAERTVTYDLGRCQKMNPAGTACTKWVTPLSGDYPEAYEDDDVATVFDAEEYQDRYIIDGAEKTIYSGAWDYSGYSLPNQYPVEVLAESGTGANTRLGYQGTDASSLECRGYPEQDSPFSRGSIQERSDYSKPTNFGQSSRLRNLNLCEESGENCQCSYKKVDALDQTVYLPKASQRALPADTRQISSHEGWYGYCLERSPVLDPSDREACLAWWPVDVVQGKPNIFENHPEAGFVSSQPLYYCLEAKGNRIASPPSPNGFGLTPLEEKDNTYVIGVGNKTQGVNGFVKESECDDLAPRLSNEPHRPNIGSSNFATIRLNIGDDKCSGKQDHIYIWPFKFANYIYPSKSNQRYVMPVDCTLTDQGNCIGETITTKAFGVDANGWNRATGILPFPVNNKSPLAGLHEYDIEKIILRPTGGGYKDWPQNNEQIILRREGWVNNQNITSDQWTAYWCTGEGCDFGEDGYTWNNIAPYLIDASSSDPLGVTTSACDNIAGGTNLFGVRAVFAGQDGATPDDFRKRVQAIIGYGAGAAGFEGWEYNLQFNKEAGQFIGIEGGLCDGSNDEGWVDFDISIQLREWCTDVVQVVDALGENKAWSGRANNLPEVSLPADHFNPAFTSGSGNSIQRGALEGLYQNKDNSPYAVTFSRDSEPFGAIAPPPDAIYVPENWDSRPDEVEDEFTGKKREGEKGRQPLYVEAPKGQVRAGSPYSCETESGNPVTTCVLPPLPDGQVIRQDVRENVNAGSAVHYLRRVFAKIFTWWRWDVSGNRYEKQTPSPTGEVREAGLDWSGDAGQCPVIQSTAERIETATPGLERNNASAGDCGFAGGPSPGEFGRYMIYRTPVAQVEGENGLPTSPDGANGRLVHVGEEVELSFYGYNFNGEQLPLRKITIDWIGDIDGDDASDGEPADITTISGNFKNHRWDCGKVYQNWGQKSAACTNEPFSFTHVYQEPGNASPIVILEDNWGKQTRASYRPATPVLKIERLNLDIPPPGSLGAAPTIPNPGQSITFSWAAPGPTGTFLSSDIIGYEISVKKNFQSQTQVDPRVSVPPSVREREVSGPNDVTSIAFDVRACTNEGCGAPATLTVAFRPPTVGAITLNPNVPVFNQPLAVSWPQTALADSYQVSITKTGGASQPNVLASANQFTYAYESGVTAIRFGVRACNGTLCSTNESTTGTRTYQDGVVINASTLQGLTQSYRLPFSHQVATNKPASQVSFSVSSPSLSWLQIDSSGRLNGQPTAADVRTTDPRYHEFTVTATHAQTGTTNSASGRITIADTCGNGTLDGGEQCEPSQIADNAATLRCTSQCAWQSDLDGDSRTGANDCNNNPSDPEARYMYSGSPERRAEQRDYNCNGTIDSSSQCAPGATEQRFDFAPSVCSPGATLSAPTPPAHQWCRDTYGSGWEAIWQCNGPREVGCKRCTAMQTLYY